MKLSGSICVAFILCVLIFPAQSECGFIGLVSDLYDQAASTTSSIASVLCDDLSKLPDIISENIPSLPIFSNDCNVLSTITDVISNPTALPTSDEASISESINDATLVVEDPPTLVVEDSSTLVVEDPPTPVVEDPPTPVVENPPTLVVEDSSTLVVEDPPTPVVEDPPTPVVENPPTPVFEDPLTPAV